MRILRFLLILIAAIALVALIGSFVAERSYASQAKLVQRVLVDQAALELFGETGTPIGEPQLMIISDPKAFIGVKSPDGAELVSEQYLQDNNVYPLQMKTVRYVAGLVRLGAAVALVLAAGALLLMARRRRVALDDRQLEGVRDSART